jgi:hypothetical protein
VDIIAAMPKYFITLAELFNGILFENSVKNKAKLILRKNMPAIAHKRDGLSEPFNAVLPKRLLK